MYGNHHHHHQAAPPIQNRSGGGTTKQMTSMHSDPNLSAAALHSTTTYDDNYGNRNSSFSGTGPSLYDAESSIRISAEGSPMTMSPWNQPFQKSPWMMTHHNTLSNSFYDDTSSTSITGPGGIPRPVPVDQNILIGSLVREEGHVYSLATRPGDLLYTGSDSKNIRVWKNLKEFSGFKSASGLVKAIVISGEKIFTGHQDGKIRVWKVSVKDASVHKRSGSLPTLKEIFKCSMKPSNYVEVKRRRRSALWIKHSDAISCLSMCESAGLLYSGSWDRTFKVWRVSDSKCLESVSAHEDAVNSVVAGSEGGLVFTGSADGTVKVWRRELQAKATKHIFVKTLIKQECAVTALAVDPTGSIVYCGSSDGLVNFWERENNLAHGGVLRGHQLAVLCLVARGSLVLSGSADKNICVWRRDGIVHVCLSVLTAHGGPVKCLAIEEDVKKGGEKNGKWVLYSGSLDKSVKVWSISDQMPGHHQQQQQPMDVYSVSGSLRSDQSER